MAWYVAQHRKTVKGAWSRSHAIGPDGALLDLVPMDERHKPVDLNLKARDRIPGIVHRWRGKVGNSGEDHYWVHGAGTEYAVVEEDMTGSGEAGRIVVQWPTPDMTAAQEKALETLGIPEPRRVRERSHPFVRVEMSVANQSPHVILYFRAREETDWSLDPARAVTVSMSRETILGLVDELVMAVQDISAKRLVGAV